MVDAINLQQLQSNASAGLSTTTAVITILVICIVILIMLVVWIIWLRNKRSYNIIATILRPVAGTNAYIKETGFLAKHFFDKNKKEKRFRFYGEKRRRFLYNGDAVDEKYFVRRVFKGRLVYEVTFTPDEKGWLRPTMIEFVKDDEGKVKGLKAEVANSDMAYYASEVAFLDSVFVEKSFFEKYYLIILVILFIICICIQWYMAHSVAQAAATNKEATQIMADALTRLAQSQSQNVSSVPQAVHLG